MKTVLSPYLCRQFNVSYSFIIPHFLRFSSVIQTVTNSPFLLLRCDVNPFFPDTFSPGYFSRVWQHLQFLNDPWKGEGRVMSSSPLTRCSTVSVPLASLQSGRLIPRLLPPKRPPYRPSEAARWEYNRVLSLPGHNKMEERTMKKTPPPGLL